MRSNSAMIPFQFRGSIVRTVIHNGEPWFVAKDVCDVLGLANSRAAVSRIRGKDKGVASCDTPGGVQNLSIISEAGLYRLVLRSDKPAAEPFIDWVTFKVLPALRKKSEPEQRALPPMPTPEDEPVNTEGTAGANQTFSFRGQTMPLPTPEDEPAPASVNTEANLTLNAMARKMSSREVAELTGKRHDHVLRDIRNLIKRGAFTGRNFAFSEYRDAKGEKRPEYLLDFDATMTLLVGYGMTYDAAKESLSKRGFKEKAVMENLPMNQSMNLGMNRTMSSREIAELTGKLHFNIMRDIKTLIGQGAFDGFKFEAVEYTDAKGEKRPAYELDFDATMTLVTGYNAVLRAKVIKRWRELEEGTAKPITQEAAYYGSRIEPDKDAGVLAYQFDGMCRLAKMFGLEGNQALLKADKAVRKLHGTSPIALLEIELQTPGNEALIIPSEMGRLLNPPISAKQLNKALAAMGLQEWRECKPNTFAWRLTDKGKNYGTYLDVGRKHSDGTPVLQIKWRESVAGLVEEHLNN